MLNEEILLVSRKNERKDNQMKNENWGMKDVWVLYHSFAELISRSRQEVDVSPLVCIVEGSFHNLILLYLNQEDQRQEAESLNRYMIHTALSMEDDSWIWILPLLTTSWQHLGWDRIRTYGYSNPIRNLLCSAWFMHKEAEINTAHWSKISLVFLVSFFNQEVNTPSKPRGTRSQSPSIIYS